MHPRGDELLALRDGQPAPEVESHVASCPECTAELRRLTRTAKALRDLPPARPPFDAWPSLKSQLQEPAWSVQAGAAWAALLLVLLSGSFIILSRHAPPMEDPAVIREQESVKEKIEPLKAQSRTLEGALSAYRSRSQVLSGRTAGTIAYLEDGLAIVDLQLSLLQTQDTEPEKLLRLWQERVKLLNALVELNATRGAVTPI
ncbi:MAG: hypothetical protein B7X11_01970 [Acidobacteria bacterium 37-65-4]|nr:MAG: hypothetical protein B7X11_01970 [Acidobacteria bacterium 37-65-4]